MTAYLLLYQKLEEPADLPVSETAAAMTSSGDEDSMDSLIGNTSSLSSYQSAAVY